jgi:hypothetical protein
MALMAATVGVMNNYYAVTFVMEEARVKTGRDPVPDMCVKY